MKKLGLVLGGGRGAYHIGIWKYLIESGIYDKVSAISGDSVGALNSCLFAMNNYNLAEKVWKEEIKTKILTAKKLKEYFKINTAYFCTLAYCNSFFANFNTSVRT